MRRLLFKVEETFAARERGTVLVPGIPVDNEDRWHIGDPLLLRRPDGTEVETTIRGMDIFHPGPNSEIAVLVPMVKKEIPIGTEVWSK